MTLSELANHNSEEKKRIDMNLLNFTFNIVFYILQFFNNMNANLEFNAEIVFISREPPSSLCFSYSGYTSWMTLNLTNPWSRIDWWPAL